MILSDLIKHRAHLSVDLGDIVRRQVRQPRCGSARHGDSGRRAIDAWRVVVATGRPREPVPAPRRLSVGPRSRSLWVGAIDPFLGSFRIKHLNLYPDLGNYRTVKLGALPTGRGRE
jgi:hypothetical protein